TMGHKNSDDNIWASSASKWATQEGVHAASVDRIINQVEKTPQGKNRSLRVDRDHLAEQLMQVWPEWIRYSSLDSEHRPPAARARAQSFREINTKATIFQEQLLKGKSVDCVLESTVVRQIASMFPTVSDFNTFLVGLDYVIGATENLTRLYE